jgi:hypothetical protein
MTARTPMMRRGVTRSAEGWDSGQMRDWVEMARGEEKGAMAAK